MLNGGSDYATEQKKDILFHWPANQGHKLHHVQLNHMYRYDFMNDDYQEKVYRVNGPYSIKPRLGLIFEHLYSRLLKNPPHRFPLQLSRVKCQ